MPVRRFRHVAVVAMLVLLGACAPDPSLHTAPQPAATADVEPGQAGPAHGTARPPAPERAALAGRAPTVERAPEAVPEPPPAPSPEPSTAPSSEPTPAPASTTEATQPPDAAPEPPERHAPGERAEEIRELQHRLSQINWLSGDITDTYDDRTRAAVDGFQSRRGLPVLGYVDQATWEALLRMTRIPSHEEMHNIRVAGPAILQEGDKGDEVRDLQARLKQLKWFTQRVTGNYGSVTASAVRGFQAKRGLPATGAVDQDTLDVLHDMSGTPTPEELADEPKAAATPTPEGFQLDERCTTGRAVCVSKSQRALAWVVDGEIQFTTDVRFGSELTPTREGVFSIGWKSRDHVSSLYDSPMPFALFFSGGQAIHFSGDFARNGYNGASYGCVNVRDRDLAQGLFETTRVGDRVVVF